MAKRVTYFEKVNLLSKHGGKCYYCGIVLVWDGDDGNRNPNWYHTDHKIPVSKGGGNGDNVVASCRRCNCRKYTKTAEEFMAQMRQTANG